MNTQPFNIRYIIVQHCEAGYSQLKTRKQSCHYYITASGKLQSVHELTPIEGVLIIAVADLTNTQHIGRTDAQNQTLLRTLAQLSNQHPQASIRGAEQLLGSTAQHTRVDAAELLKTKAA